MVILGRIHFQAHLCNWWQKLISCGLLDWGPSLLAIGQKLLLSFFTHEPLLHGSLFHQSEKAKNARENLLTSESPPTRMDARVFCNLIIEVTFHQFWCTFYFRSKLLGSVQTQEEGIIWRYEFCLEVYPPHTIKIVN